MRRAAIILVCCSRLQQAGLAEIVDRLAVSVGNRVITEVDVDCEIRITALQNGEKPDFSGEAKRQTAERMVDQMLIRAELEANHYSLPSPAEVEASLKELKQRFRGEAAYQAALSEYGITEDEVKARLAWQTALVRFIDVRFRPGIQVGDDEIRDYFNQHVRPVLEQAHPGQTPSLDEYRDSIERTLTSQGANQQVEQWLTQVRRRARIQYHEEVFR